MLSLSLLEPPPSLASKRVHFPTVAVSVQSQGALSEPVLLVPCRHHGSSTLSPTIHTEALDEGPGGLLWALPYSSRQSLLQGLAVDGAGPGSL